MTNFVSLHNHTTFSILNSLSTPRELFTKAKELGQTALAITDHGTLAAAAESLKLSQETGIKLIMGCEMYFLDDVADKEGRFRHVILLAKNATGYRNLLTLNKEGFDNAAIFAKRVYPLIDWTLLDEYHEGLICLTSCSNGIIAQLLMNKKFEEAETQLRKLHSIFGDDLGLEVEANTLKRMSSLYNDTIEQVFVNAHIIKLGKKLGIKVVATTNSHYCEKEDAETHDVMLAIGSHQPVYSNFRPKYDCDEFYVKTGDEVKAFFERNYGEDYAAELCANSLYFAEKCESPAWIDPKFSNPSGKELPEFPCKDEADYLEFLEWQGKQSDIIKALDEDKNFLRFRCEKAFSSKVPVGKEAEYQTRIEEELDVFYHCGVSSYMLIVADYVSWARQNGVLVGAGRGSVGGSLVGYLLDIHKADSIKYGLVFARFHNKLKASYSDIDMDFSQAGREKVIAYIVQKYGRDHVAQISNFIGITPKVYARDIARACELGGSRDLATEIGNDIAGCIPTEIKTIDDAIKKVPLFGEYCKRYPELAKYKKISGKPRNNGLHAAGIIISKRPLHTIVPTRRDKDNLFIIEYDKDVAEENGLVKMDILGLSTLDTIDLANQLIVGAGKTLPDIDIEAYDEKTYDLISRGDTYGVFQFGTSGGTIDLCRKIKPKCIEDLALITTIARPASRDIREAFIKARNSGKEAPLLHPSLKRALGGTFGFPLYDESLLILAKDVAGWDLDEADKLRKLTKEKGKNPEKVKKWHKEFIEGATINGVHEIIAEKIWTEIIEPFGKYSFNSSHAILYSMISMHTAYLKAHFPIEFLLANLMMEINSNAPNAVANIQKIKSEIRSHRVKIIPPDLNKSKLHYTMQGNKLITGLDALKFVSDEAINDIISKRPFTSFQDFMARVSSKSVRANTIQALISGGCLDEFGIPRHLMHLYCSDYRKKLQVWTKKHDPLKEEFFYPWTTLTDKAWTTSQLYAQEQFYLGEGFICGIKDAYGTFFNDGEFANIEKIKKSKDKAYISSMKATIKDFFEFKVKKEGSRYFGQSMLKATIEDVNGDTCNITIFPDRWKMMQDRIKEMFGTKFKFEPGVAIHFSGTVNYYEEDLGMIMDQLFNINPVPQRPAQLQAKKVSLRLGKADKPQEGRTIYEEIEDELINEGLISEEEDNEDYAT